MKILFLGTYIPERFADQIPMLSAAGNQFQYNLVNALKRNHEVHTLSYIAVPTEGVVEAHLEEIQEEGITVFLTKSDGLSKAFRGFRAALRRERDWADCLIAYNAIYPWFWIGGRGRKNLILADYTPAEEETGFKRKLIATFMRISFAQYDRYVALSEKSGKYLRKGSESVVINGAIRWENFQSIKAPDSGKRETVFLYSGVLNRVTGVDLLLSAFQKTANPDYRLVLCGQGDELAEEISESCKSDPRVCYKGYVSKKEYYELLEQADVVVNPRNMELLQNKYNFPSKVLEYIASGRVVLSTKFSGYQRYEEYILLADSNADDLRRMMNVAAAEARQFSETIYYRNREFARKLDWGNVAELFVGESSRNG